MAIMEIVWLNNVLGVIRIAKSVQEEIKTSALSARFKTNLCIRSLNYAHFNVETSIFSKLCLQSSVFRAFLHVKHAPLNKKTLAFPAKIHYFITMASAFRNALVLWWGILQRKCVQENAFLGSIKILRQIHANNVNLPAQIVHLPKHASHALRPIFL